MLPIEDWYAVYWSWLVIRDEPTRMMIVYSAMKSPSACQWLVPNYVREENK